jgi:hypothetical protein
VSEFLPQRLDVDTLLVPSRGIKHPEGVTRLPGLPDHVAGAVRFLDEGVDDSIEVLVDRSGYGRREDQGIFPRNTTILFEASEKGITDGNGTLFVVLGLESKLM